MNGFMGFELSEGADVLLKPWLIWDAVSTSVVTTFNILLLAFLRVLSVISHKIPSPGHFKHCPARSN